MWHGILDRMMRQFVAVGALELTYPDGTTKRYGEENTQAVGVTLSDPTLVRRLIINTDLAVGEGYMDGTFDIRDDDVEGLLTLAARNAALNDTLWWRQLFWNLQRLRRGFDQWNPAQKAKANVAHHYDLSTELYELFLDPLWQYSCGYFAEPGMDLAAAQRAKIEHIAKKLLLEPDMQVFEIGCGWGSLALTLAQNYGVRVLGVTLSEDQHRIATEKARQAGLSDRVRFELKDYRSVDGQFDRIVSVGMFEHVGAPHYKEYFDTIRARLNEDGVALVHTIGRIEPPGATSPWIKKYIFPGGYCPSMSEVMATIEKGTLYPCDVEIWRMHYAHTLRAWFDNFVAREDEARALFDDKFCRMWRYYLKACEVTFRHNRQCVFQIQLAHHQEAVPVSRDYLYAQAKAGAKAAE